MVNRKKILDIDPLETKDWIESLNALIEEKGDDNWCDVNRTCTCWEKNGEIET